MRIFKNLRLIFQTIMTIPGWLAAIAERLDNEMNELIEIKDSLEKIVDDTEIACVRLTEVRVELEKKKEMNVLAELAANFKSQSEAFKVMAEYFRKEIEFTERSKAEIESLKPTEHDLLF